MWRMSTALLTDTCPYNAQKLLFVQAIRGTIGNIWVRGEKVQSGFFSPRTVPIFRSESAHYVIFVQMSREMWHFDTDDGGEGDQGGEQGGSGGGVGGEIVFNKLVNGFLPELFKRWKRINAHHLVSIILFTRVVYENGEPVGILNGNGKECEEFMGTPGGISVGRGRRYRDFYRVVISSMASSDWTIILHRLKREFTIFLRDVLTLPVPDDEVTSDAESTPVLSSAISMASRPSTPALPIQLPELFRPASSSTSSQASPHIPPQRYSTDKPAIPKERKMIITGRPSAAIHGNILEVINLATFQFSQDYVDRDLVRTGVSVVIITPGTGHFEVDYDMLKATTDGLITNGMGVDLVCLSKVPLHTVPLFKYRNPSPPKPDAEENPGRSHFLGISPPKVTIGSNNSSIPGPSAPPGGEWVYAVPHWIDVSFWSAASEKKLKVKGVNEVAIEKKPEAKSKRKHMGFKARCKMYELQMMGIMENEISEITVPFLYENPFWRPMPVPPKVVDEDLGTGDSASGKEVAKVALKESFKWMDEYDNAVFAPLPIFKGLQKEAEMRRTGGEGDVKKIIRKQLEDDSSVLGTSFHGEAPGRGQASVHGAGFFDRKMKERRPELDSPIEIRADDVLPAVLPSAPNATSAATPINSAGLLGKPSRLVKNISFGFKAWGVSKATAKTGLAGAEATAGTGLFSSPSGSGVMITRGFDTGESSAAPPKSPLSPRRDGHFLGHPSPEKLGWGSRPISIKNANSAISSLEAASRDRDRRRSIGSGNGSTREGQMDIMKVTGLQHLNRPNINPTTNQDRTLVLPPTVSPTSALAPWVQVLNPSNPKQNPPSAVNQFRRWHHVFPKPLKISTVKWKSLCSPAALPLTTEHFPTAEQLRDEYQENPYVISQNEDEELEEIGGNREELVRAMIGQRLARGFQIVVGNLVAEATAGRGGDTNIYEPDYMVKAGSSCFMTLGSQIHQLICDEEYNVEVKRYVRKPVTASVNKGVRVGDEYISYMKTVMSNKYVPIKTSFKPPINEYNWNYVDQYIGGYEETLTEQLRYWRARFVLIPNEPPESARRVGLVGQHGGTELNDEEIHLEGIRRLTQVFQRNRYIPPDEYQYERFARRKKKERDPLQILYKTFDPSVVVAQELESLPPAENNTNIRRSQLLSNEQFDKKTLDLHGISLEIQGPRGVRLENRRWHLRYHSNCFVGDEMVTWILENFRDCDTRQEAEEVGSRLFRGGLFQHVDKRHDFRDGNYFYRIAEPFLLPQARPTSKGAGWFTGTFTAKSIPPTPAPRDEAVSPLRSRSSTMLTDESSGGSYQSGFHTPTPVPRKKAEVELSKVMKYDLDPSKRSYRKELINLHYDRLHNPENCYHIRIDWMNSTAKLIEDSLTSWARTVDRYGLKLVEAPIDEVSNIPGRNPFRSPCITRFCVPPPPAPVLQPHCTQPSSPIVENMEMSTILIPLPATSHEKADPYFFHKLALRKFHFVLDTESARNFPVDVKVRYSWGVPTYRWSQYIHRSGSVFCQITDEGSFLLMANRLYTVRTGRGGSPLVFPPVVGDTATPESIKGNFSAFCNDAETLKRFYDENSRPVEKGSDVPMGNRILPLRMELPPFPLQLASPVLGPQGAGSPTTVASSIHGVGRTTSMSLQSGRSSIVDVVPDDFVLSTR